MEEQKNTKKKNKPRGKPFAKGGDPRQAPGRPEGTKNRSNLNLWLGQIWEDIEDVSQIERFKPRIEICKWAVGSILAKVANLPGTPGDSAQNAANAFDMMNNVAPAVPPVESNPEAPAVDIEMNGNGTNGAH